ncbi:hypothetical protein LSTR_LSTR003419 [Laodelphax striatellus]|uniref:Uncharacterized protein n=1 Tax=Laodelphax striatellus TaxID=195883 RepID=A0A482X2K7_LAOST|nr:hypothetical protein LSTR_LSTR003419 [Laodelphax striatellus]
MKQHKTRFDTKFTLRVLPGELATSWLNETRQAITILSVLVSSTMSAVLKDAQLLGSSLKLTQQQKGGSYAYTIPDHRLGIIPATLQVPEAGQQSEYVYFEAPKSIPHIYKQAYSTSPSKLQIISIQEIPLASSLEKTSKLRERLSMLGMIDRESYLPAITKPSTLNEKLDHYLQEIRQSPQRTFGNLEDTKMKDVTANLFRQANDSLEMEEGEDDGYLEDTEAGNYYEGMANNENLDNVKPEVGEYGGMIPGLRNDQGLSSQKHSYGRPFAGIITPSSGNINSYALDTNKELGFVNINSDLSTEAGFDDTMGRIAAGKDVPEAEGDSDEGLKVKTLESILKLVGGGKTPAWVKKAEAAPVRVEATDYRTNFSEEMCSLWPENLQWSAKAVRASLLVAQDMGDVKTFAKSKYLGLHVENITETAKEASFHIVLAIDLRGAPVARAVRSAQKAVGAAVAGSEAALRVATEYATSPGARFAQLVLKAAQRADDAAQIAKDIIRNVNLND